MFDSDLTPSLHTARRLVVKIGSRLIADESNYQLRRHWLVELAEEVAFCCQRGQQVIIVTSGAVALARGALGLLRRPLRLDEKQAAAAYGQVVLMQAYQSALADCHLSIAQVLLTFTDTEDRKRHLNARATIDNLLQLGIIPVINENDTVATEEIRYGDNDRLAARVAQMTSSDTLVLLSDIDGLYTADPVKDEQAQLVPLVEELTPDIIAMAGVQSLDYYSSGGMVTKLEAARICLAAGCRMVIAKGDTFQPLRRLDHPAEVPWRERRQLTPCTWFLPNSEPRSARKRWIAAHVSVKGALTIDEGAAGALLQGKSLLPAGIIAVEGQFKQGDLVVVQAGQQHLAYGLVTHDSEEARSLMGRRSQEIEQLGYHCRPEMIHRDDLVVIKAPHHPPDGSQE